MKRRTKITALTRSLRSTRSLTKRILLPSEPEKYRIRKTAEKAKDLKETISLQILYALIQNPNGKLNIYRRPLYALSAYNGLSLCKEENLYKSILLNSLLKTMLKMLKYNNYILI